MGNPIDFKAGMFWNGPPPPGTITISCPPRSPFVPGQRAKKKAQPRRIPRAWTKQANDAKRAYRKELVRMAGWQGRWSDAGYVLRRARKLIAEIESVPLRVGHEGAVRVPRSLRGGQRG